uniref:E3 ubiquitin-protein ligase TRIM39-like n=1 Tax=Astyanax mexicanus TaxID=7994 RepID=A0A8B9JRK8_ASTMX
MASSCCILSEDQFLCGVCLRMFTDPVSTPCGHNFCKSCLNVYWDNSNRCKCPMCNKIFENRPDLSVNTLISELEAQFEKSTEVNSRRDCEHEDSKFAIGLMNFFSFFCFLMSVYIAAANWFMGKWLILLFLFSLAFIFLTSDTMWMSFYAVDVTLDPDTASPYLILSDDGKQVRDGDTKQNLPDNPERFYPASCVLGKEGFSSGRFYYEVQVSGKTDWDLGVARESINRKGEITLSPQDGFWTVWLRNGNEYEALADPPVPLFLGEKLQKVGVFVDYEEGLVSFYDVEARSHIYSFTGQTFTEKLYPYFSPCLNDGGINSAPLIISDEFRSDWCIILTDSNYTN